MSEEKRVDAELELNEAQVDEKEHIEEAPETVDVSAEAAEAAQAESTEEPQGTAEETPVSARKRKIRWMRVVVLAAMMAVCFAAGVALGYFVSGAPALKAQLDESERLLAAFESAAEVADEEEEAPAGEEVEPEATGVALIMNDTEVDADTAALSGADYTDGNSALISWGESTDSVDTRSSVAAIEYDGGSISVSAVIARYNELYAKHVFAGGWSGHDSILKEAMRSLAAEAVGLIRATELGLAELTAEDIAAISEAASAEYLALPEGSGITVEQLEETLTATWWQEKLFAHVTGSVTVSESDVEAAYAELLAEQKELFSADPAAFEDAFMGGEVIVYNPAGYRLVDYVLIPLSAENAARAAEITGLIAALDPTEDAATIARYEIERAGLYTDIAAAAEDIHAAVAGSSDIPGTIRSITGAGTKVGQVCVSQNSDALSVEFMEAVSALSAPGAYTEVIRTDAGYVIACYSADVAAGEVAMADVETAIEGALLAKAKQAAYDAQMNAWLADAGVLYYPDRMQ